MKLQALAPYLQIAEESVAWTARLDSHHLREDQPVLVEDWHPSKEVVLAMTAELSLALELKNLGLDPKSAKLGMYVTAHSGSTGYKWVSDVTEIADDFTEISWKLPPNNFGGSLKIECCIVVSNQGSKAGELSPPRYAALARNSYQAILEGDLARPSIVICEFNSPRNREALWEFDANFPSELSDWYTADLSTVISIKLNNKYFDQIGSELSYAKLLAADFLSILVEGALADPEIGNILIEENPKDATGTLWVTLKSALQSVFTSDDAVFVYQEYRNRREQVRSIIQSVANTVLGGAQ